MSDEPKSIFCHCYLCGRNTYHTVRAHYINDLTAEQSDRLECWQNCYLVQCDGCHSVMFASSYDSPFGGVPDDLYEPGCEFSVYPKSTDLFVNEKFRECLPPHIYKIYSESVTAINSRCSQLAMIGFRATVEAICKDWYKCSPEDDVKLVNLIDRLHNDHIISKLDRRRLHSVRLEGNGSVHEIGEVSDDSLKIVKGIVDNIIDSLYVLEDASQMLKTPFEYAEFEIHLNKCIAKINVGDVRTLKRIVQEVKDDRLVMSDLDSFKEHLNKRIQDGSYECLTIVDENQYKVVAKVVLG